MFNNNHNHHGTCGCFFGLWLIIIQHKHNACHIVILCDHVILFDVCMSGWTSNMMMVYLFMIIPCQFEFVFGIIITWKHCFDILLGKRFCHFFPSWLLRGKAICSNIHFSLLKITFVDIFKIKLFDPIRIQWMLLFRYSFRLSNDQVN